MVEGAADVVVDVVQLPVLEVERPAADAGALAQQDAFGAARRDVYVGGDGMRAVQDPWPGEERHGLGAGPVGVAVPCFGDLRPLGHQPLHSAAVDGQDVVLTSLDIPLRDHLDQLVPVLGGKVVVLRRVLGDVVQLPVMGIQVGQRLRRDRRTERLARLGERRTRPRAHGPPPVVVDRAVAEHLEVLGAVPGRGGRVVERVGEADAVDRRLGHSPDRCGWLGAERVQDGRDHVDDVRVLGADLTACLDAVRPGNQERVAGAAAVGLPLPPPERRVPGPGPAPRVVVEGRRPADLVNGPDAVFQRLGGVVEELQLIGRPGGAALGAGPVVGHHHDQRVVELAGLLQEVKYPAQLVVGVRQEPGDIPPSSVRPDGGRPAAGTPSPARPGRGGTARHRPA